MESTNPPSLPLLHLSAKPIPLTKNITLQTPLSRRGNGPGLIILLPDNDSQTSAIPKKILDPEPLKKWAEEGFAVVQVRVTDVEAVEDDCNIAIKALQELRECTSEKLGVIVYDLALAQQEWAQKIVFLLNAIPSLAAITLYTTLSSSSIKTPNLQPLLIHTTSPLPITNLPPTPNITTHTYPTVLSPNFVLPSHEHYASGPASLAHTRTLQFLRTHLNGPQFDLEIIWDEHCALEFGERSVERTMATMVDEPYVNHVPTMTGGIGRRALTAFYRDHFIFANPADTALDLISRTVGVDRVIDEFIFCFTHDRTIDWLIPGIPPTHRKVRIPFTSVVNIRGDRLYHEHIAWDQCSLLRQLGLMPEYLPYPYPLPDGRRPVEGKRFEYRVPTAGVETASKMVDEGSVVSNEMLGFEVREVDDV